MRIEETAVDRREGERHVHVNRWRGGRFRRSECGGSGLPVHDTTEKGVAPSGILERRRTYLHVGAALYAQNHGEPLGASP
jgi:hypothetical protein